MPKITASGLYAKKCFNNNVAQNYQIGWWTNLCLENRHTCVNKTHICAFMNRWQKVTTYFASNCIRAGKASVI